MPLIARLLGLPQCENPPSPLCSNCTAAELFFSTCPVLADTSPQAGLGVATGWIMYLSFLIPLLLICFRRISLFWLSFTPYFGLLLGYILQSTIPSPRPPGACTKNGDSCGMPSGHCIISYSTLTFLFIIWGTYIYYHGLYRFVFPMKKSICHILFYLLFAAYVTILLLMPFGRVFIKYHTVEQAGIGVLTGFLLGTFWFLICHFLCTRRINRDCLTRHLRLDDDWSSNFALTNEDLRKRDEECYYCYLVLLNNCEIGRQEPISF